MCPSNTSELLCGVPTSNYLNVSPGTEIKVQFDVSHRGFILWSLASSPTPIDALISKYPSSHSSEVNAFLEILWIGCDMSGPNRTLLKRFLSTFIRMVVKIARASVQFHARSEPSSVLRSWEVNPILANTWLRERMAQDHAFSDWASAVHELEPERRVKLADALGEEVVGPSAVRWLTRNVMSEEIQRLRDEEDMLRDALVNCADVKKRAELLNEGEQLDKDLDACWDIYRSNGGKMV